MDISATNAIYLAQVTANSTSASQGTQASSTSGSTSNLSSVDFARQAQHGGGLTHALFNALQSLGLTASQASTSTSNTSGTGSSTAGASDSSLRADVQAFIQALVQGVQGANGSTATTSASGTTGASAVSAAYGSGRSGFSAGLSALISQVSSGNAPAGLQSAYNKLVSDLQNSSSTASASSNSTASTTNGASLQALLTQLQQNLGYSTSSNTSGIGGLVSTAV